MVMPREEEQLMQTDEPLAGCESKPPVPAPPSDADTTDAADIVLNAVERELRGLILAESERGDGEGAPHAVGDGTGLCRVNEEGQGTERETVQGSGHRDCEEGGRGTGDEGVSLEVVEGDDNPKLEYSEEGATERALGGGLETAACLGEVKDKAANYEEDATTQHMVEEEKQLQKEPMPVTEEKGNDVGPVEHGDITMDDEESEQDNGKSTVEKSELEEEQNRNMEEAPKEVEVVNEYEGDVKNEGHIEDEVPLNEKEAIIEERSKTQFCNFPQRPNAPDCAYYLKTGKCAYGLNCRFNHPLKGVQNESIIYQVKNAVDSAELNFLGLPLRPGEKECPYYMRNGLCKFSTNCRFHHPDPTTGSGNNSPSGYNAAHTLPHPGALQLPVRPRPMPETYHHATPPPNVQSYAPWMCQTPQIVHPSPGRNGNQQLGPSFAPLRQPSAVGNSNHRPNSYNYQRSNPMPDFPQRYGQPDCPYYMKTGDCKYKSACKFNHPKNRLQDPPRSPTVYHLKGRLQDPAASRPLLNPLGLPLRPGQDVCMYYKNQGICKFGPSCKFDHPMDIPPAQLGIKPRG